MKSKILYIVLGLGIIVSIAFNVYQFNIYNNIIGQTEIARNEIDSLNEKVTSLISEKSAKDEEIVTLSEEIEKLQTSIEALESENESLSKELAEQSEILEETKKSVAESTPAPTEEPPAPTETPSNQAESSYSVDADTAAQLKRLGATEEQISNIHSRDDLSKLVYQLMHSGTSGSGSSSGSTGGSTNKGGSTSTGSSSTGNDEDPWGDISAPELGHGAPAGSM